MGRITNAKEARAAIGKIVEWEEHSSRYIVYRCGIVDEVSGRNICIEGSWQWMADLKNLKIKEDPPVVV